MLFTVSTPGWWLIALAATLFFMAGLRYLATGVRVPDDLHPLVEGQERRLKAAAYVIAPVFLAVVLAINLLRPDPEEKILFLYSIAMTAVPIALWPVRGRLLRATLDQRRDPESEVKSDPLMLTWIIGSLTVMMGLAAGALILTGA